MLRVLLSFLYLAMTLGLFLLLLKQTEASPEHHINCFSLPLSAFPPLLI